MAKTSPAKPAAKNTAPNKAPAAQKTPKNEAPIFSVSALSAAVKSHVEGGFAYVRVRGEVGRVTQPRSGHMYLDLKDETAVLASVVWRAQAAKLPMRPEMGMEVVCTGRLTTYAGQSRYQLVIEHLELAGAGALMALLEKRRALLAKEGLFDEERKQPIPFLPEKIGVVTSPSGAVLRDITHRISDRFPRHLLVWPVRVQGEGSAEQVAAAIAGFNALPAARRPDLIIVARGGGSLEDLWAFNEDVVVRAAAASHLPLISAIGHETDTVLLDYAADYRAPTPTAAAERAVPVRAELVEQVEALAARQRRAVRRVHEEKATALAASARGLPTPSDMLAAWVQSLDDKTLRLAQALKTILAQARTRAQAVRLVPSSLQLRLRHWHEAMAALMQRAHNARLVAMRARGGRLQSLTDRLRLLDHEATLQRGFAMVFVGGGAEKTLLRSTTQAPSGTPLAIQLANKKRLAAVSDRSGGDRGGTTAARSAAPRRRKPAVPRPDLPDLFAPDDDSKV